MLAHKYECTTTLVGHTSSITVLLFSPDGEYLASGSETGTILVTATESWTTVKKLVNVSPITALLWDPTFPMTIVCGFASGAMVTVHVGDHDTVSLPPTNRDTSGNGPLNRIDRDIKSGQTHLTAPSSVFPLTNLDGCWQSVMVVMCPFSTKGRYVCFTTLTSCTDGERHRFSMLGEYSTVTQSSRIYHWPSDAQPQNSPLY